MRTAAADLWAANSALRRSFPTMGIEDIGGPTLMGTVDKLPGESLPQTADRLFNYLEREVDPLLPAPPDWIVVQDGDRTAGGSGIKDFYRREDFRPLSPGKVLFHAGS